MHFLQSHMTMLHYTSPASTYSCGVQMVPSPSVTASSDWQSHVPLNMATGLHLHHESISHPVRNVCGCSGVPTQSRSSTLLGSSSPESSCVHLCCSDRDGATAHRLQGQCGPFQASRTTPNSPCMTHSHGQRCPSLLSHSSAFSSFPVIGQAPQVGYNTCIPIMSTSKPLCSSENLAQSHPSLSAQTNTDLTRPNSQTPIQSCVTPTGEPQFRSAFSSLTTTNMAHNPGQQCSMTGPRQNNPVGSSPVHQTQDHAHSAMGQLMDRDCTASEYPEPAGQDNTDDVAIESQAISSGAPAVDFEPLLDL